MSLGSGGDVQGTAVPAVPAATVARLPLYLGALNRMAERSVSTVSSVDLACAAGVKAANVRRDLSQLGSYGRRGVGYDVATLIDSISAFLGVSRVWAVAVVGVGNLGRALASYQGYRQRGLHVVALFDSDESLRGRRIGGLPVRPSSQIVPTTRALGVSIGMIATPPRAAQLACDGLVAGGVSSVLSFASVALRTPQHVDVRHVDLGLELQLLAFQQHLRSPSPCPPTGVTGHPGAVSPAAAAAPLLPSQGDCVTMGVTALPTDRAAALGGGT